jgi:integrase
MINRIHSVISRSLKQAVREQILQNNPAEYTVRPPIKSKEVTILSPEEINRYLDIAKKHRLYSAFLLEYTSGLRRGELLALTWDCVDFSAGTIEIKKSLSRVRVVGEEHTALQLGEPKTESGNQIILLLPDTARVLKEHRKHQAEEKLFFASSYHDLGFVFAMEDGRPVDPRNFNRWHTEILKEAELHHIRVHDLRHSFASILADAGEDPETLRALLGHSRTSTTMDLYCHASDKGKRRAISRLAYILKI